MSARVTQAEGSVRQRQAAGDLAGILGANRWLPAITWPVNRTRNLSRLIAEVVRPTVAPGGAFRIWRRALALGTMPGVPEPDGRTRIPPCPRK